jgi:hypothetical protein
MEALYHYCSAEAFTSIVSKRAIWLSSMSMSNDSMEGKVLADTFGRIFERDGLSYEIKLTLRRNIQVLESIFDGLGFCLSEKEDLLSQWRGYAANGAGFSIGFSKDYLLGLSRQSGGRFSEFKLLKVLYDPHEQEQLVRPIYDEIKSEIDAGRLNAPKAPTLLATVANPLAEEDYEKALQEYGVAQRSVSEKISRSFRDLYTLKMPAFFEEQEWRLISFLTKTPQDKCEFRVSDSRISPYREYKLQDLGMPEMKEVILGPKNTTPEYVVFKLLEQNGFRGVNVRRSSASYR